MTSTPFAPAVTMPAWPADRVHRRFVADLVPYARNARTHSVEQVNQLCASIQEWGWTMPVLVDETGGIIAGHGRVMAALQLGLVDIPVMVAEGWSEAQRRAYVLADNKLALNAGWDMAALALELQDIQALGFDTGLTGFSAMEFAALTMGSGGGLTDPDEVPEVPAVPVSALGDVWLLGRHRITCGSCTEAQVVNRVLAGVKPHLMVTDPPYGVNYDPAWRARAGVNAAGAATGKVLNDDKADWREAWALFPGTIAYVWHAGLFAGTVLDSLVATGFEARSQIIWTKSQLVMSRGHYHWQHEPCWYAVRKGGRRVLGRRSKTKHGLADPQAGKIGNGPRHAEAH